MNRQEIIEKIRKLLSLSSSPNRNEAERAAEMARELIEEWQINASELDKGPIEHFEHRTGKKKIQKWEIILMANVCRNNFCRVVIRHSWSADDVFTIVGRTVNVVAATEMYSFLEQLSQREWKRWMKDPANRRKKKDRHKFLIGFAAAISSRLKRDTLLRWSDDHSGTSLVATVEQDVQAIDEYIRLRWPEMRETSIALKNQGSLKHGLSTGFNASLARQMREEQLAIGAGTKGGAQCLL